MVILCVRVIKDGQNTISSVKQALKAASCCGRDVEANHIRIRKGVWDRPCTHASVMPDKRY